MSSYVWLTPKVLNKVKWGRSCMTDWMHILNAPPTTCDNREVAQNVAAARFDVIVPILAGIVQDTIAHASFPHPGKQLTGPKSQQDQVRLLQHKIQLWASSQPLRHQFRLSRRLQPRVKMLGALLRRRWIGTRYLLIQLLWVMIEIMRLNLTLLVAAVDMLVINFGSACQKRWSNNSCMQQDRTDR